MYQGRKHNKIIIVGSGSSLKTYRRQILQLIKNKQCTTIGINKMTSLCHPDYHLWTNQQRYRDLGKCIDSSRSTLMFGYKMPPKLIRRHHAGEYLKVTYKDSKKIRIKEKMIQGQFRTAGALAIAIAHLMEAKHIWVVGMDGYTYYPRKKVLRGKRTQHCYGVGHTDDATWEEEVEKDKIVSDTLDNLAKTVKFSIITPTKFDRHYDPSILGVTE